MSSPPSSRIPLLALCGLFLFISLGAISCGDDGSSTPSTSSNPGETTPETTLETLPLTLSLEDATLVVGGELVLRVEGSELLIPKSSQITLRGSFDNTDVDITLPCTLREENSGATFAVVPWDDLSSALSSPERGSFQGEITVRVLDIGSTIEGIGALQNATVDIKATLTPSVELPTSQSIFLNETQTFPASGLLRTGEGTTSLEISGIFTADTNRNTEINFSVPVQLAQGSRSQAEITWPVDLFGIRPGNFDGMVFVRNTHTNGQVIDTEPVSLSLTQNPTELDAFDPPEGSRGQILSVLGRGFIPPDPENARSMFFVLEGTFQRNDGRTVDLSGANLLRLAPEIVPDHTEARIILRSEFKGTAEDRSLTGLTATPGTFQGTVTPALVAGADTVFGRPFTTSLRILPTRQLVFIKFLPGFSDALEMYGMRNVEFEIRTRIFDVLQRDYRRINIAFLDERPRDFAEYSVIEVGGPDPNGAGLLGLDNTVSKDTLNIRLDDIIGGANAETEELGSYSFGGVFIESFRAFSPTLDPSSSLYSSAFDDIFSPFSPELGGQPVQADEWPDGARYEDIDQGIFVMGSLIGNTITHEIGHSLGLSFFEEDLVEPGERYHNSIDTPGAIMDAGIDRPFEERAELEDEQSPFFTRPNQDYLEMILPLPE